MLFYIVFTALLISNRNTKLNLKHNTSPALLCALLSSTISKTSRVHITAVNVTFTTTINSTSNVSHPCIAHTAPTDAVFGPPSISHPADE